MQRSVCECGNVYQSCGKVQEKVPLKDASCALLVLTGGSQPGRRKRDLSVPWAREISWRARHVEIKIEPGGSVATSLAFRLDFNCRGMHCKDLFK